MRKSDKVTHVGYTVGGNSPKGKLSTKVRFTLGDDNILRTKELLKMGMTDVYFIPLPEPMTREDALRYMQSRNETRFSTPEVQAAIAAASKRILGTVTPTSN